MIDTVRISIHAPRAGSDPRYFPRPRSSFQNFNPCSPCGERLVPHRSNLAALIFQSMLPVRGATSISVASLSRIRISIHAPRAGSDRGSFGR